MVVIYSVKFWNKKAVAAIVENKFQQSVFFEDDFEKAIVLAEQNSKILVAWSSRVTTEMALAAQSRVEFYRIEDGFIRSVGLGAGLRSGCSFVIDRSGIYYEGSSVSDLEVILENSVFSNAQLDEGAALRALLVSRGISKYNLSEPTTFPLVKSSRLKILVVGQVADDASVLSNPEFQGALNPNLLLLTRVRSEHPSAFICYKPHPDVQAGLRKGRITNAEVCSIADGLFDRVGIIRAIEWCDELHTISSLAGFEALIRSKPVTTYGRPFYAGWSLTYDRQVFDRRTKELSIDALVYASLVDYSHYYNPYTRKTCRAAELIPLLEKAGRSRVTRFKVKCLTFLSRLGNKLGL